MRRKRTAASRRSRIRIRLPVFRRRPIPSSIRPFRTSSVSAAASGSPCSGSIRTTPPSAESRRAPGCASGTSSARSSSPHASPKRSWPAQSSPPASGGTNTAPTAATSTNSPPGRDRHGRLRQLLRRARLRGAGVGCSGWQTSGQNTESLSTGLVLTTLLWPMCRNCTVNGDTQEIAFQSISSSTTHWIVTAREFDHPNLEP